MSKPSLRIGIACWPTFGGSGVVATEIGLALADQGHEIHFLAHEYPVRLSGFRGNVFYHQVSVPDYPLFKYPPYALALATKMAEVAENHHLDLIHAHYAIPHSVSAHLAKEMSHRDDLKIIATLHGTDITIVGNDTSYTRVTRFSIEKADGVTAVSKYLTAETHRIFDIERHIETIPNFIDLERFQMRSCPEADSLRQAGETVLIHVSNFRPVKRVFLLVKAFAALAAERPARLLMVGDGPDRAAAEALATELGVQERVHFLGSQDAVETIIPCADIFVLPSRFESFGLSALEAMACGVPVIGARGGGLPEVVVEGETGWLFEADELDSLTTILVKAAADKEHLKVMGQAARRRAEEHFALQDIVPRYEKFYREVLGN
ncbi:MAG: N-acetyl-alpha-D-glucosaminyl L-malate synthase BshA [Planctomycetota bacterium]